MKRLFAVLVGLASVASMASAQQFWDKKPYDKWSKDECKRMLEQSPWAQKYNFSVPVFAARSRSRAGQDVTATGGDATLDVIYVAQLRSALPMRQAVAQQALLQAMSQHPSAEQMDGMKKKADAFINSPVEDIVLVHFVYGSNDRNIDQGMARYWQQQTVETLKDKIALIGSGGKRVAPIRFEALPGGGREFAVTFPRMANGAALVEAQDQSLTVEFYPPRVGSAAGVMSTNEMSTGLAPVGSTSEGPRAILQFKVKDMTRDGKVVY